MLVCKTSHIPSLSQLIMSHLVRTGYISTKPIETLLIRKKAKYKGDMPGIIYINIIHQAPTGEQNRHRRDITFYGP